MAKERIFPFRSGQLIPNSPFRILKVVGAGGMAGVYRALDVSLQKEVVIKMLHPELADSPAADLMRKEARALAAMYAHSNAFTCVLRAEDVVVRIENGSSRPKEVLLPYYVMEPIAGPTLREVIVHLANRDELVPLGIALGIGRDIATALSHAHGEGIVHRDIKPDNIMFHGKKNEPWEIRVIDFGVIARMRGDINASDHSFKGTLIYAAPEQLAERPVSGATDLYSLGVVLFEMVVGRLPFIGSPHDVAQGHLYAVPPRLSDFRPELPPGLVSLVDALLTKDPFKRVEIFRRRASLEHQHGLVLAQALEDIRRDLQASGVAMAALSDVVGDIRHRARADHTTDVDPSGRGRARRRVVADDGPPDSGASTAPGVDHLLDGLTGSDASEVVVRKRRRAPGERPAERVARDDRTEPMPAPLVPTPSAQRAAAKTDVDAAFIHEALFADASHAPTDTQPYPGRVFAAATLVDPQPPMSLAPITPSPVVVLASGNDEPPPEAPRLLETTAEIMRAAWLDDNVWQDSEIDALEDLHARSSASPPAVTIERASDDVESDAPIVASAQPASRTRRPGRRTAMMYRAVAALGIVAVAVVGVAVGIDRASKPLLRANGALAGVASWSVPETPPSAPQVTQPLQPPPRATSASSSASRAPGRMPQPSRPPTASPIDTSELDYPSDFKRDFPH